MTTQRTKNMWKIAGTLIMLGFFVAVMLFGPLLREGPRPGGVDLPAMTNVPPAGSLQVELQSTESEGSEQVE